MASMARQISRDPFGFDLLGLARAVLWPGFAWSTLPAEENLTTRAVTTAGLAALVTLPFLLLCSVLLSTPLAVPAAIGACYLAVSHALSAQRLRRASLINSAILFGLVGWLIGFLLTGEGPLSHAGLTAALMAPVFAAAPAVARSLIAKRVVAPIVAEPDLRNAALTYVALLEEQTPMGQVLVVDREASVLAASSAARRQLGLLPDAFEHALTGLLSAEELRRVLESIALCRRDATPSSLKLTVYAIEAETLLTATLSPCCDGAVAMQLGQSEPVHPVTANAEEDARAPIEATAPFDRPTGPASDIGEAVAFACHRFSRKAATRKLRLTSEVDATIAAACDRQVGRRIAHLLIDNAVEGCEAGGTIRIAARRLRGVVLLRTITSPRSHAMKSSGCSEGRAEMAALEALVDGTGGTLVIDARNDESVVSVRLPAAPMTGDGAAP
jgi:hypothetical protein